MRIPVREPFAADWILTFLARRAIGEIESVDGATYTRRVTGAAPIRATVAARSVSVSAPAGLARQRDVKRDVTRLFDLAADSAVIDATLGGDAILGATVRSRPGLRVPGALDGFELAVRAILGQQVSVARATDLARLLVRRYGADGRGGFVFPGPGVLARQTPAEIGMPGTRGDAIRRLAEAVARGDLDLSGAMPVAAARRALLDITGIGPWTVEYIAMRALRDADAFPHSDWVICKRLGATPAQARSLAEAWRPFRAYAVMYLWADAAARRAA
jgi:AraC family transcriptional regulator, regulatory protein of adaptative response / DNA-3-methyladenine glycosylase II